jgi:single-strand DNA-binding protein
MASLNKVQLIGRLGKDPEARSFQDGGKVVNFSLAMSENWTDKQSGERKERTQWANVAIFNDALAEVATRFLKKGSQVYVEGQLETRTWDKDGIKHYATEVVLRQFNSGLILLDKAERPESGPTQGSEGPAPRGPR